MECSRCRAQLPEVAHFCHRCGQDMRSPDLARRKSFAVKPDEPVASFALISSIMPRGVGDRPQTYRIAFTIALVAALAAAISGALPIAVLLAAFAVPIVYIVYIYDVNLWEDEPVPVTALAFLLTAVLGAGLLLAARGLGWFDQLGGIGDRAPDVVRFLLVAVLVPVVGEVIRQIGPVILASRPEFDDLMDGLTFGVISGVAFATADTLVRHWSLVTGGFIHELDPGLWASLIFLEGFIKPLIFGTATGIACAEFSGLGKGYDGFTGNYARGLADALLAQVAYAGGIFLLGHVDHSTLRVMLQLIWALVILGVLIIRVRTILHTGLMEAALEASAREGVGQTDGAGAEGDLQFCGRCEMPLLTAAAFCTACGAAGRTTGRHRRQPALAGAVRGTDDIGAAADAVEPTRTSTTGSPGTDGGDGAPTARPEGTENGPARRAADDEAGEDR